MDYKEKYKKYKLKYINLKNQIGGKIKNAATALFFNNYIYLVKEINDLWNLPGGNINRGETWYDASIREFTEEIGDENMSNLTHEIRKLPEILRNTFIYTYTYHKHTIIYLYYLEIIYKNRPNIVFKTNSETIEGGWFNIDKLPDINPKYNKSITNVIKEYRYYIQKTYTA